MGAEGRRKPDLSGRTARVLAVLLALLVWQGTALLLNNPLLLSAPLDVARRLVVMAGGGDFWRVLGRSFCRITGGFLLALAAAGGLAAASGRWPLAETLLRPYMACIRSVPVASFIVIALLWLSARRLSVFISFLMVLPVLYTNLLQGIRAADGELLEMAAVFHIPRWRRWRGIRLPALRPYLLAGCRTALGLCWKAGVAAEVIAVAGGSVGERLYNAKVYLEIADLFAWTAVIVGVSALFERLFLRVLERALDRLEAV